MVLPLVKGLRRATGNPFYSYLIEYIDKYLIYNILYTIYCKHLFVPNEQYLIPPYKTDFKGLLLACGWCLGLSLNRVSIS
jgi:hypothetical protein